MRRDGRFISASEIGTVVLLQEGVAPEPQSGYQSSLTEERPHGWNPTSQGPQSPPASRPPAAGGGEHRHACLRSDPHYAWDLPLMDPMTIAILPSWVWSF